MTTPSETRAGKLPELCERWRKQAAGCEADAERLGSKHSAYNELMRDASQHRQSAYQLEKTLEAIAASEPGEAIVPDGSISVQGAIDAVMELHPGADELALNILAACLTKRPAPEQPGKGEAFMAPDSTHDTVTSGDEDSGGIPDRDGIGSDGGRSPDAHDAASHVQGDQRLGSDGSVSAGATPQPSDPAEGDALRALLDMQPMKHRNDATRLWQLFASPEDAEREIAAALSTPPTAAVSVDDAMVERACRAFYGERWLRMDKESSMRWMRAALTAALDPQVKR